MALPKFPQFKTIDTKDKEWVEKITSLYPPFSDFNFTSLHCWNTDSKTSISLLNNNLILKMKDYTSDNSIYSVIGHSEINKTIDHLLNNPETKNEIKKLNLIPETNFQTEKEISGQYLLEEDRDQFDYIYDLEELSKMEGSKYHNKRNLAKRFERENKIKIEVYQSFEQNIHQQIIELVHIWAKKKIRDLSEFQDELTAIDKTAEIMNISSLLVIVLFIHNKMVGFTISELLQNGYSMIHFEKTDPDFVGISEYLMKITASHLRKNNRLYLNYQQDLGIEGLRKSKMSYNPHFFLKKYTISHKKA